MKLSDAAVKNPSILKWNPLNKRYGLIDRNKSDEVEVDDEEEVVEDNERSSLTNEKDASAPPLPMKENPLIVSIYGQICIAAKSYQSAICAFMISSQSFYFECLLFKYQFIFCMHMTIIPTIR